MDVKVVKNIDEFEENVTKDINTYYLLPNKTRDVNISDFIENSGLDDKVLLNLKVAYEVKFQGYIQDIINNKKIKVSSLSEALKKLSLEQIKNYKLIINTKDKVLLSNIMQQFIYLDLKEFDIATEEELIQINRYENFKKNRENLKLEIEQFENEIINYKTNNKEIINSKSDLKNKIEELKSHIYLINDRKLNISVMATKKSGKSVIVNSFLGQEYAPTSSELATPNTIVYTSWNNNNIEVKIEANKDMKGYEKDIIKEFNTTLEVNQYIKKYFKNAEKDIENSKAMPDIYVQYPKSNSELDFNIIDTPGPDLAGAEHKKIAYNWIDNSDAIIFAIDYSKYLTKDEEKFLNDIKKILEEKGKFYSFIIVVNKIDLMYTTKEKSSIVRFLDFLQSKLKDLGYDNVVIMGTTSMNYFSSLELQRIATKNSYILSNKTKLTEDILDDIGDCDLSSSEMTELSNIKSAREKLKTFHKIRNTTLSDIEYNSGMPALINRVKYLTTTKASVEIFNSIFSKMDRTFNNIKNEFLATKLKDLIKQKEAIEKDLNNLNTFFKKKESNIADLTKTDLREIVIKSLEQTFSDISKKSIQNIETTLYNKKKEIEKQKKDLTFSYEDILKNVTITAQKSISDSILEVNKIKDEFIDEIEIIIIDLNDEIKEKIKEKDFDKKYGVKISLSELNPELAREEFDIDYDDLFSGYAMGDITTNVVEEKTKIEKKTKDVEKQKIVEKERTVKIAYKEQIDKLFQFFREVEYETKYKDVKEKYNEPVSYIEKVDYEEIITYKEINNKKLNEKFEEIKYKVSEAVNRAIREEKSNTLLSMKEQFDNFYKIIERELKLIIKSYKDISDNLLTNINSDKNSIESIEKFFKGIEIQFNRIEKNWLNII